MLRFITFLLFISTLQTSYAKNKTEKNILTKTKSHYFHLHQNKKDKSKEATVYILLHGVGDNSENFIRFIQSIWGEEEAIFLAPEGTTKVGKGYTWSGKDINVIKEMMVDAIKRYKIKKSKIRLIGFSAGCIIGFLYCSLIPDHIDDFGGFGGFIMQGKGIPIKKMKGKVRVFYSVGQKDPNIRAFPQTLQQLKNEKITVGSFKPTDSGHTLTKIQLQKMLDYFNKK
ncbi:MAG: hypothetical protein COA79_10310 [Planctomycetota bacterium]|nr:MAG: hypothetical protein COA79_10310 [Planctomycetota bacterium]